jgi:hypothetical protein
MPFTPVVPLPLRLNLNLLRPSMHPFPLTSAACLGCRGEASTRALELANSLYLVSSQCGRWQRHGLDRPVLGRVQTPATSASIPLSAPVPCAAQFPHRLGRTKRDDPRRTGQKSTIISTINGKPPYSGRGGRRFESSHSDQSFQSAAAFRGFRTRPPQRRHLNLAPRPWGRALRHPLGIGRVQRSAAARCARCGDEGATTIFRAGSIRGWRLRRSQCGERAFFALSLTPSLSD